MNRRAQRRSPFGRWIAGVVGLGALLSLTFGGCALDRSGTLPRDCTADTQCDDANPCTVDTCNERGLCGHEPNDDVVLAQVEYDCRYLACEDGEPVELPDSRDFLDDGESCTVDSCTDGKDTHAPRADGATCEVGENAGTCAAGKCQVECTSSDPAEKCDDQNPCTTDSCNLGTGYCAHEPLDGALPPGEPQTAGDCRTKICANGKVDEVFQNSDLPDDGNPCTSDVCTEGTPTNPNQALDVACSVSDDPLKKVCDGSGSCVQCNAPAACNPEIDFVPMADWPKAHPECYKRACSGNVCGWEYTPDGTPLTVGAKAVVAGYPNGYTQVKGDCKELQCDGKGLTKLVNLPDTGALADLPDDTNACTKDVCTNGVPTNPPEPEVVTKCGANNTLYCDGKGSCVGCVNDAQCPDDSASFCRDDYCDVTSKTCKVKSKVADGTPVPAGQQVVGDCKQIQCNATGGTKVVNLPNTGPTADLPEDNKDCTQNVCTNGTPSHPPQASGFGCNQDMGKVCNGMGACVECTNAATHCPTAPDCQSATCSMGKCGVTNDALNSNCDTQTTGDCKTNQCNGMGACTIVVNANDPTLDANPCTMDVCVNGANVKNPVTLNTQVAGSCDNTNGCANGPCACDGANNCESRNGAICANGGGCISGFCADGFCCDTACTTGCAACSLAKGATANGTCTAAAVKGAQDAGTCDDTAGMCDGTDKCTCNAAGVCKVKTGEPCLNGAECATGNCVDGFCCDAACTGACSACSQAKGATANGTCTAAAVKGAEDAGACDTNVGNCNGMADCVCDAAGTCKVALGQVCANNGQCASGFCADGVCCNTACAGGCDACSVAKGATIDGMCTANVVTGAVDTGSCDAMTKSESCVDPPCICDMNGTCTGDLGSMTTNAAQCLSGFAVDGVCCDSACTGTCARCDSVTGMCLATGVTNAQDTGTCDDANGNCGGNSKCSCDAMGSCLRKLGESCANNGQCASGTCGAMTSVCE